MLALVASPGKAAPVELREAPEPQPARNEALVAVRAISLNRGEVRAVTQAREGARVGWDIAGVVEAAAADGSGPAAGTRVVGLVQPGGWAQRVAVRTTHLAALPDGVSFAAASTLPVAGLTALFALAAGGLLLGKRVLITGAAGGVGRFAVQLAARAGAHTTAVTRDAERAAGLRELGADAVTHTFTRVGAEFDLILESAGGESLAAALCRVAANGTIVSYGDSSREPVTINAGDFFRRSGNRLLGFLLFPELEREAGAGARGLAYLASLIAAGQLDPQIAMEASWRDPGPALAALLDRRVAGKAVLHID